jgi:hypothetical protein
MAVERDKQILQGVLLVLYLRLIEVAPSWVMHVDSYRYCPLYSTEVDASLPNNKCGPY